MDNAPVEVAECPTASYHFLFVFDRSDTRQSPDDPGSWWHKAVTKSGPEGWISGTSIELSWIDPLKVNREVFLGTRASP